MSKEACAGLTLPPEGIHQPCNRVKCLDSHLQNTTQSKDMLNVVSNTPSDKGCLMDNVMKVPVV